MVDELRDRLATFLAERRLGVLSAHTPAGPWAAPAWYRLRPGARGAEALAVECLLPRSADAAYYLEQDPRVLLLVPDEAAGGLRWLLYRGSATFVDDSDWAARLPEGALSARPADQFLAIRVAPDRIDLIDERQGWGARETLDF